MTSLPSLRERRMEETIKLNFGSLYHTVKALHRSGLIVPAETKREGRRPERTIYKLSEAGRSQFLNWVMELIRQPIKEYSHFEAGLCFISHVTIEKAIALLEERVLTIEDELDSQRKLIGSLLESGLTRLSLLEIEHSLIVREAELQWTRRIIKDLRNGNLEWRAGARCPAGEKR